MRNSPKITVHTQVRKGLPRDMQRWLWDYGICLFKCVWVQKNIDENDDVFVGINDFLLYVGREAGIIDTIAT